ncbi:hypothetical protein [Lentzea cavernae]|nr:hypothetical protein [Lentzea cavernae]
MSLEGGIIDACDSADVITIGGRASPKACVAAVHAIANTNWPLVRR